MPSALQQFLPFGLEDLPVLLDKPRTAPREVLSAGLVAYLKRLGAPRESLEAARRMAHPSSRAIVTGQQAGLLTGPAYTFYKAHSALEIAKQHASDERPVLPVFWVASQDHDTNEVRSVHLLDFDEKVHHLSLELPPARPTGRISFVPYVQEVCALMGQFGGLKTIQERICQAMIGQMGSWSYSEVFARLLLDFLGPQGLVLLDPMAPELAHLFVPAIEHELSHPLASSQAINQAAEAMKHAGLEPSLGRGEAATNLFLEGQDGIRRLLKYRKVFEDGVNQYSQQELLEILHHEPSRITPAAGLRPVLQDSVLPTAGLVVGPGELRYVAELGGVYQLHGTEHPAVIRRMGLTVLEPPIQRILQKYGLEAWAFQAHPEELFRSVLLQQNKQVQKLQAHLRRIEADFAAIQNSLSDPALQRPRHRAQVRVQHEIERLERKIVDTAMHSENTTGAQFARLERHLAPGEPQERHFPFLMYLLKHGNYVLEKLSQAPATGNHTLVL